MSKKYEWDKNYLQELVDNSENLKEVLTKLGFNNGNSTSYSILKRNLIFNNIDYKSIINNKIKDKWKKDNLINIINKSYSYNEVLSFMNLSIKGANIKTLIKYINLYNIDISHFKKTYRSKNKLDLKDILIQNSTYTSTVHLKNRLYKEGLKEKKCEKCSQDENWNGEHMSLILDHINGINNDNRIENLRIVCPNCNATLSTHCRNNKIKGTKGTKEIKEKTKNIYYCDCGNIKKTKKSKTCEQCYQLLQRKVERPSNEQLLIEIKEMGYSKVGKKYGVSDNAIRKWIKI